MKVNNIEIPSSVTISNPSDGKQVILHLHPFTFTEDGRVNLLTFGKWREKNSDPVKFPAREYNAASKLVAKDEVGDGKTGRMSFTVTHAKKGKASDYAPFLKARFTWQQTGPLAEIAVKVRKAKDASILALPVSSLHLVTSSLDIAFLSRVMQEMGGVMKEEKKTMEVKDLLLSHVKIAKVKDEVSIESALLAIKADSEVKEAKARLHKAEKEVKEKEMTEARLAKKTHSKTHLHKPVMHAKEETTIPSMTEKEMKEWAKTHKPRKAASAKRKGKAKVEGVSK